MLNKWINRSIKKSRLSVLSITALIMSSSPTSLVHAREGLAIASYKDSLAKGVKDINSMIVSMKPHRDSMNKMTVASLERNAVLKNFRKVLKEKNESIYKYMQYVKKVETEKQKLSFQERISFQLNKRELASTVDKKTDLLGVIEQKVKEKDLEIEHLKKLLVTQRESLNTQISTLSSKITDLNSANSNRSSTVSTALIELQSKYESAIRLLNTDLIKTKLSLANFKNNFNKSGSGLKSLTDKNTILTQKLKETTIQIIKLKEVALTSQKKFASLVSKNRELKAHSLSLKYDFESKLAQYKSENAQRPSRLPASIRPDIYDHSDTMRKEIISKLQDSIDKTDLGYIAEINEQKIIISMDQKTLFNSGSTVVSDEAQHKLKVLIGIFSKRILQDTKLRERIKSINIVGHSSPRYKSKFVDIENPSKEAYSYNLKLSTLRAHAVADAIFNDKYGTVKYENILRKNIQVSGRGFSLPIEKNKRELASLSQNCGDFNCQKSRRVEIQFDLIDTAPSKAR